jgi:hypothetical protein
MGRRLRLEMGRRPRLEKRELKLVTTKKGNG